MNRAQRAYRDFAETDSVSLEDSYLKGMDPLLKLLITVLFITVTVSFHRYDIAGLITMALFPALAYSISGVSLRQAFRRTKYVLPFILAAGIFNPFFDRKPIMDLGALTLTGGMISMMTLMIKGVLCILASYLLSAVTPIEEICQALRRIGLPKVMTSLILMTYRYVALFLNEVSVMSEAYELRSPGRKGIHISAWGSFLGQLILRTMDRSEAIYESMKLRGFNGEFYMKEDKKKKAGQIMVFTVCILSILLFRFLNPAALIGKLLLKGVGHAGI